MAGETHRAATAAQRAAEEALRAARRAPEAAERALGAARDEVESHAREIARRDARAQSLDETIARFEAEWREADAALAKPAPRTRNLDAAPADDGALAAAREASAGRPRSRRSRRAALDIEKRDVAPAHRPAGFPAPRHRRLDPALRGRRRAAGGAGGRPGADQLGSRPRRTRSDRAAPPRARRRPRSAGPNRRCRGAESPGGRCAGRRRAFRCPTPRGRLRRLRGRLRRPHARRPGRRRRRARPPVLRPRRGLRPGPRRPRAIPPRNGRWFRPATGRGRRGERSREGVAFHLVAGDAEGAFRRLRARGAAARRASSAARWAAVAARWVSPAMAAAGLRRSISASISASRRRCSSRTAAGRWASARATQPVPAPPDRLPWTPDARPAGARRRASARIGGVDHGGKGEAGGQLRRRLDQWGERRGALGPGGADARFVSGPIRRRLGVQRRVQVIAQGRGQGGLVARRRRDLIQRRGEGGLGGGAVSWARPRASVFSRPS